MEILWPPWLLSKNNILEGKISNHILATEIFYLEKYERDALSK